MKVEMQNQIPRLYSVGQRLFHCLRVHTTYEWDQEELYHVYRILPRKQKEVIYNTEDGEGLIKMYPYHYSLPFSIRNSRSNLLTKGLSCRHMLPYTNAVVIASTAGQNIPNYISKVEHFVFQFTFNQILSRQMMSELLTNLQFASPARSDTSLLSGKEIAAF